MRLPAWLPALGGVTTAILDGRANAAVKREVGGICRKHGDCTSGACGAKDRTGRQDCVCSTGADCPEPADSCAGDSAECPYDPLELELRICYGGVIGGYRPTPPPPLNPCDIAVQTICKNNVCDDSVIRRCSPPPQ